MTAGRRGVTEQAASAAIEQACRMLRLPTMRDRFAEIAAAAEREQLSYLGFLAELVMAECDDRDRRRAARRVREASFPRPKRLEEFSFEANPAVSPAVIGQLATCGWVKAGHPLCLIGDSGTGKTHLLIALGTLAAEAGHRVRYTLASKLVNELVEAADERQLTKLINRYGRVDLICLDELGYMELDRRGAELLFQVLTEREERSAIAIASNEPFSGWTKTFTDPRLCAAIVDRLTFAGQIIETGTVSYLPAARGCRATTTSRPTTSCWAGSRDRRAARGSCSPSSASGSAAPTTPGSPPHSGASSAPPGYDLAELRTDLARFTFLLGHDDGEQLFGTGEN
jgi:DNA replication protein DnaC